MSQDLKADPSMIGDVPETAFAIPPDPAGVFAQRARRFAFLAGNSNLADYLRFLAEISLVQADLAAETSALAGPPDPASRIDRISAASDPALDVLLTRFCERARAISMPDPARAALAAGAAASADDRRWLFHNLAKDLIPPDATAPHLLAAAAWQVHLTSLAATIAPDALVPRGTGICPACGGKPVSSSVVGGAAVKNVRYCTCASCATQWNEVRIKCLCCGSTRGISYKSVETDEATVKAECCDDCRSWVKILYQSRNRSLEPVADDVGSLGLDLLMRDSGFVRGGFHPFLAGF